MTNEDIALHAGATVARWQREALEIIQKRVSEQQQGEDYGDLVTDPHNKRSKHECGH